MAQDRPGIVDLLRRQTDVMRGNLVAVCRMALKSLVDQSCFYSISDECEEFINFCAVLEGILNHRIKCSRTWMGDRQFHYWDYMQATCHLLPHSCIANIAGIENIRSAEAKGRAFVRCALMEKRLSEYLSFAVKQINLTKKFYDEGAVLLSEDAPVICGMLLGLNAIDFSFCLKGSNSELLGPLEVNFKPYLHFRQSEDSLHSDAEEMRELSVSSQGSQAGMEEAMMESADSETRLRQVERQYRTAAEQKGYLEELVRLRETQLEEAQEQARTAQSRLQRLENESRTERRQLETIVLELQGQLTTMKSVYQALQMKLAGMAAQTSMAPPPHSTIPMVEMSSDATIVYSAVTHQLTQSFHSAELTREETTGSGKVRRLQQDTGSLSSFSTLPREDNRSLMSGASGHFGAREDTQSLIPLAGSISSEFGIRPAGREGVVMQTVEVELMGGVEQEEAGGPGETAPSSDEVSLSSAGQGIEAEVGELEKSYQAHEVSQASTLAREEKRGDGKANPTLTGEAEEAVVGGKGEGDGEGGRGEGDRTRRQGGESLTGPGSGSSTTSDTPDFWELVSENGREEQRQEEGRSEREAEESMGEMLQGRAAQYYSLGVPQEEEEEEEETEEGSTDVADPLSRETAPPQGEGSRCDPSDLVMVSSSEDSAPLSGGVGGTGEEEGSDAPTEESQA